MTSRGRSIGIKLNDIIDSSLLSVKVIDDIKICSKYHQSPYGFKTIFYHDNLLAKDIKLFIKRQSDKLFEINASFTKDKNTRVFFLNSYDDDISNYRYRYKGNIFGGFKQYMKLVNHIKMRENERKL